MQFKQKKKIKIKNICFIPKTYLFYPPAMIDNNE